MPDLETRIGYRFRSRNLLDEALRHASILDEETGQHSYQRLEFLGDAVLNLCIAGELFRRLPGEGEGGLSKARSALINNRNLVRVGERIGIPEWLHTDPSLREVGGGVTRKMIADVVEAVTGAIFLDGGYEEARGFVLRHFWEKAIAPGIDPRFDAKSRLQEWCQGRRAPLPEYHLAGSTGPPHSRTFHVSVRVAPSYEAKGSGRTKKEAETEAASRLLAIVEEEGDRG